VTPNSSPAQAPARPARPTAVPIAGFFLAGVLVHLLVVGSVVVAPGSRFLPILWFLAGAFLPLATYVLLQRANLAAFAGFVIGIVAASLVQQHLMYGHVLPSAFGAGAFLIPVVAGAAAFAMIALANRNA